MKTIIHELINLKVSQKEKGINLYARLQYLRQHSEFYKTYFGKDIVSATVEFVTNY